MMACTASEDPSDQRTSALKSVSYAEAVSD